MLIWIATPFAFIELLAGDYTAQYCWIPTIIAIVGPFLVWIGSWAMYALGEFVEDIDAIRTQTASIGTINRNLQTVVQPPIDETKA